MILESKPPQRAPITHSSGILARWLTRYRIWVVLVVIIATGTGVSHGDFLHLGNLVNVLFLATPIGLAALGETLVILTAGIDLSVAAVSIFAAVIGGMVALRGVNPWGALACGLVAGLAAGAVNGLVVARLRVPPLIATLGMLIIAEGLARILTGNAPIMSLPPSYQALGTAAWGLLPVVTVVWVGLSFGVAGILQRTEWGKTIYAAGANPVTAFFSGLRVKRTLFLAYCIAGILAALSGTLQSAYLNIATPNVNYNELFEIIAGAVVGGTSLFGGDGSVINTMGGVLVIVTIQNLLLLLGISPLVMQAVVGLIIVLAVWVNIQLNRSTSRIEHKGI